MHQYQTFGTYTATLIANQNNCTDSKTTVIVVIDSILPVAAVDTSKTGPLTLLNKTIISNYVKLATIDNNYQLLINYPLATPIAIKVLAANSTLVYSNEQTITQGTIAIPLANCASGEYYITVRSNYGVKTFKVLQRN